MRQSFSMNNDTDVVRVDIFVDGKMDVQHMTMVAGQLRMNDAHLGQPERNCFGGWSPRVAAVIFV